MRFTTRKPGRLGRWLASLGCAGLLSCILVGVDASSAVALGEQCSGASITGKGAFLQSTAQSIWSGGSAEGFNGSKHPQACGGEQGSGGTPKVSFVPLGSGAGLHAWGADDGIFHDKTAKFVATEQPPAGSVEEEGSELGKIVGAIDSDVAVVPVAQMAIAVVAHPPALPAHASCAVSEITGAELEDTFAGQLTNWRQLSAASDKSPGGDCDQAITRVVRAEDSGATYQFKHYLDRVNSEPLECTGETPHDWAQLQSGSGESNLNLFWPRNATCAEGEGPLTVAATSGEGSGAPLQFVAENAGTITYGGLPEAEKIAPTWVLDVDNGVEAASPVNGENDANCAAASYKLPSGWESGINVDWSQVYGADPNIGEAKANAYPICTLTWDVVAANSFHVFGKKVATTLRDYLQYVRATEVEGSGRHGHYYYGLPGELSEVAGVAIAQIEIEEGEEGEEEGGGEEGGSGPTGTRLCRIAPSEEAGVLLCPKGKEYAGEIRGTLAPETTATFEGSSGAVLCKEGLLIGQFNEDGTSSPKGGVTSLGFEGKCTTTIPAWEGAKELGARLESPPLSASRFVYLNALAPQGAFVFAKAGGAIPQLQLFSSEGECIYEATYLSGQILNGTPTQLSMNATWKPQGGGEECPSPLQQSATLDLTQGKSEATLYVASE